MGCTASAPTSLPINAGTADKSIQFEEEAYGNPSIEVAVADIEDENRTNETKVLPSCDNTEEPVQLARNNKSSKSLDIDKDIAANGHATESEEKNETVKTPEAVKIPKLELLMEKVFETNHHLLEDSKSNDKLSEEEKPATDATEEMESTKNNDENSDGKDSESNENETEMKEEEPEAEDASPSQSQGSRATRWEALADIAAELPPSLAVDPVTGQIFQIAQPKRVIQTID